MSQVPSGPVLQHSFGYTGEKLCSLQPLSRDPVQEVCFPSLSGVCHVSIPQDAATKFLHWIPDDCDDFRDVTCIASHPKGQFVAIADRRMGVRVGVYGWPSRRSSHVVKDSAMLQVSDMCWNRSGSHFAVLSGDPRHSVSVFTVEASGKLSPLVSQEEGNEHQYNHISFNPRNPTELCTSGGGHIAFWKIEDVESAAARRQRLTSNTGRVSVPGIRLTCHTWLTSGTVLAGTQSGALIRFDATSGIGEPIDFSCDAAVVAIVTTKHCVVVCSSAGELLFLAHDASRIIRSDKYSLPGEVTTMAFTALDSFVLGTSAGLIAAVILPGFSASTLPPEELSLLVPKLQVCEESFGKTVSATVLPDNDSLVGINEDGVLRVRSLKANAITARIHAGEAPAQMTAMSADTVLTLHRTGEIRFINAKKGEITEQLRIVTDEEVASLDLSNPRLFTQVEAGHISGNHVLATFSRTVVVIDRELRVAVAKFVVPEVFQDVLDISFIAGQPGLCAMSTANSTVILLKLPQTLPPVADDTVELPILDFDDLHQNRWRCELPFAKISVLSYFEGIGFNLLGASIDRDIKFSTVDLSLSPKRKDLDTKALKLPLSYKDHSKACSFLATFDSKLLMTAGTDGRIVVRNVSALANQGANPSSNRKDDQAFVVCRHNSFAGGIAALSISGAKLTTVGGDGSVAVWSISGMMAGEAPKRPVFALEMQVPPFATVLPACPLPSPPPAEAMFFLAQRKRDSDEADIARHAGHREEILARVAVLRDRLREIRAENDQAAEDESVNTEEFLVDRDKALFQQRVADAIARMRDEVKWHDLRAEYVAHTLTTQCWDTMSTKLTPLHGMVRTDLTVYSCHERQTSSTKLSVLRKLKFLRRIEETERATRDVHELESLVATDEAAADTEAVASPLLSMKTDLETKLPPPEAESNEDISPYLYRPVLAYTRQRAVTQILLLEAQSTNLLRAFNGKFSDLQATKKSELDKIKERNIRSSIIQKELGDDSALFEVSACADEDPNTLLHVPDSEIPADKTHDPEEKRRVAAEEAERERWRRQHGNDDSSDRALKLWMDGRLEKEIKTLKVDVQEPDFAVESNPKYVPLEERSDDQLRIYREYEKKFKQRSEEVAQRRKLLQAEFALLQKENKEAAARFDQLLEQLLLARIGSAQHLARVDLYRVKLAQSVAMQVDREIVLGKLEKQRRLTAEKAVNAMAMKDRFKVQLDRKEAELTERTAEEKSAEKNLRSMPPFSEHEEAGERLAKIYLNAKKKAAAVAGGRGRGKDKESRTKAKEKGIQAAKLEAETAANPDPFAFIDAELEAKNRALQEETSAAGAAFARLEKPEGIHEGLWDAFMAFVQDRVNGERDIKRLRGEVEEMRTEYQRLEELTNELRTNAHERANDLFRFRTDARDEAYDTDDLRMYRQGQVEVPQPPVATDYADAVLIHARDIHHLNQAIRERGESKIKCMERMMGKRSDLRYVDWELEKYQYQCETLAIEYKHLHTLRVTKQMQEFIHGGAEGHNERERAKLHAKIDHVRSTMSAKIEEKKQLMSKVKRTTKERELENTMLLEQVSEAQGVVDSRRSVRDLQSSELERERHNRLMRDMRVTRKLEDVAKAQQEEMAALRKEIDRLRERTFPSFAVVSKRVIGNPDEA